MPPVVAPLEVPVVPRPPLDVALPVELPVADPVDEPPVVVLLERMAPEVPELEAAISPELHPEHATSHAAPSATASRIVMFAFPGTRAACHIHGPATTRGAPSGDMAGSVVLAGEQGFDLAKRALGLIGVGLARVDQVENVEGL